MTGLTEMVCKPQHDIYSSRLDINRPISSLQGLTVRKVANIIHNSLMLVENPEEINYNTAAKLYGLLTKEFTFEQKIKLDFLLNDVYASEDDKLAERMAELSRFKDKSTYATSAINTEEDLAADVMANLMYNAAKANATFDVTRKTGDAQLEQLADRYVGMRAELRMKGINFEEALAKHLNHMVVETQVYKKYANEFMNKYTEKEKSSVKFFVKGNEGQRLAAPVNAGADIILSTHLLNTPKETVIGGELGKEPLFNATNKDLDMLLDGINALNG